MIIINDYGKLAPLDGIANEIENQFADKIETKIAACRPTDGGCHGQVCSRALRLFSGRKSIGKKLINFKLAMRYKFVPQEQKMALIRNIQAAKLQQQ